MSKNTKLDIIQIAKILFNERGYNDVSTQDISDALGISKGNLNYHFRKKEDIIEAVVEEMHSHYSKPNPPKTLGELNMLFLHSQQIAKENAFYFWHYTQLSQMPENIKKIQNTVISDTSPLFCEAFTLLNEEGSLQSEEYLGQYEQIIQAIMLTCIYWTPYNRLDESREKKWIFLIVFGELSIPYLRRKAEFSTESIESSEIPHIK